MLWDWCCVNARWSPLTFISKALGPKSRDLSTYKKEYMVTLVALQH
jgi:hypothetical protein